MAEILTTVTKDAEVSSKEQVVITVSKQVIEERLITLSTLDADIAGFDSNIAQAQLNLDYWLGRQAELIALREKVAIEVDKVVLISGEPVEKAKK